MNYRALVDICCKFLDEMDSKESNAGTDTQRLIYACIGKVFLEAAENNLPGDQK